MSKKRTQLTVLSIILVLVAGLIFWLISKDSALVGNQQNDNSSDQQSSTETEVTVVKQLDDTTLSEDVAQTDLQSVLPQISSAVVDGSELVVRSFVPSIIEDGGVCTLELSSSDSVMKTGTVSALADATTTICPVFRIDISDVASGKYQLTVGYSSQRYSGSSQIQEINL